ncbi:hypothetical protein C1J01_25640 [Nonomuraea aridisoli]|uniref:Uncharacterized protein n=2 Tax=Nonomuraea aridisoli TaxID=2070368 RepID=A0A2W2DSF9_9ACTN|nr:hypothetical protein C1J01_25640 [Nonomuraea aridisoli]
MHLMLATSRSAEVHGVTLYLLGVLIAMTVAAVNWAVRLTNIVLKIIGTGVLGVFLLILALGYLTTVGLL